MHSGRGGPKLRTCHWQSRCKDHLSSHECRLPQVKSSPLSETATECSPPAAMLVILVPVSETPHSVNGEA